MRSINRNTTLDLRTRNRKKFSALTVVRPLTTAIYGKDCERDMERKSDDDQQTEGELIVEIVCAGEPYCDLKGDKALRAQQGGCIWCAKIYTEPDGREILDQPGMA